MTARIYTIGHSTRSTDELLELLRGHQIRTLADVRRFPGSRRFPHFSRAALETALAAAGLRYAHLEDLGGRRKPFDGSANDGWRNEAFRAYADHMASAAFREAIETLLALPPAAAILCAEAVPWRCHRNLIADELTRRGIEVLHLVGAGRVSLHQINPMARDAGGWLVYPSLSGAQQKLPLA